MAIFNSYVSLPEDNSWSSQAHSLDNFVDIHHQCFKPLLIKPRGLVWLADRCSWICMLMSQRDYILLNNHFRNWHPFLQKSCEALQEKQKQQQKKLESQGVLMAAARFQMSWCDIIFPMKTIIFWWAIPDFGESYRCTCLTCACPGRSSKRLRCTKHKGSLDEWMNGWMAGWSMIWGVNQQF